MSEPDDFALKRALDELPRSIEPPTDLWPGIRSRRAVRQAQLRRARLMRVLVGTGIIAAGIAVLVARQEREGAWRVAALAGGALPARLEPGDTLATAAGARALLEVGRIGHVEVEPATHVALLAARATAHRLRLTRGTIHARIAAPPRLFVVETPAGTAVDLGCAYRLEVDSAGNADIRVTLGWIAFEDRGRESLVPAGMRLRARLGRGVGTPHADDAPESLRVALDAYDAGDADALDAVLGAARSRDAVTLWHLLARTDGAARARVADRLLSLVPPPEAVQRDGLLRLDRRQLRLYWTRLPGTLQIISPWTRMLWTWWLRLFG